MMSCGLKEGRKREGAVWRLEGMMVRVVKENERMDCEGWWKRRGRVEMRDGRRRVVSGVWRLRRRSRADAADCMRGL